jgi:ribonuclease J
MTTIITPLGGFGEVGRNCLALDLNGQILIIDMGFNLEKLLEFETKYDLNKKPSLNFMIKKEILPKLNLLKYKRKNIVGILCSHAHLDHIGAIPYLARKLKCNIYATPFTSSVIKSICDVKFDFSKIKSMPTNAKFNISGINIEFIPVAHSTPQSVIIAIHSPIGIIMYANDFKLQSGFLEDSQTNLELFEKYKNKVKVLFLDCLYSSHKGSCESEFDVIKQFQKIEKEVDLKNKRAIIVSTFSSHIERLITLAKLGKKYNKKIVFIGSSLSKYIKSAKDTQIVDLSEYGEIISGKRNIHYFFNNLKNPKDYYFIVTGHQGEPNSVLKKMADGLFDFTKKDLIIFSNKIIPAKVCEENREKLEKKLNKTGVQIIKDVHVSGHLFSEDHKQFVSIINPQIIVPSHGENFMEQNMVNLFKKEPFSKIKVIPLKIGENLTF